MSLVIIGHGVPMRIGTVREIRLKPAISWRGGGKGTIRLRQAADFKRLETTTFLLVKTFLPKNVVVPLFCNPGCAAPLL